MQHPQTLSQSIKDSTWDKFRTLYLKKFRKEYDESIFTVLSSLSLVNRSSHQYKIVSIGLGTKSLPQSALNEQNSQDLISDMHGQMLAIRGLRRFLLEQVQNKQSQYLKWNPQKQKYSLKEQYQLYLYCSEVFCGDCCIDKHEESYSGAKPLAFIHAQEYPNLKFMQHVLRTKPGRMDLPMKKRSALLSCSDLIAVFNVLGLQGKKLFSIVTPIYLSRIILDSRPSLQPQISNGTNLVLRLHNLLSRPQGLLQRQIFKIIINGKQRQISSQFHHQIPEIIINPKQESRNREGFDLCGIFTEGLEEWLNGKTGLPQGSSLANYAKKGKISKFSQSALEKQFAFYTTNELTFKYEAILQRIRKLFGEWVTGAGE